MTDTHTDPECTSDAGVIDVSHHGTTLRMTDVAGNAMTFDLTGWNPLSWSHEIEEPMDAVVTGRVSEMHYDLRNAVAIERLDGDLCLAGDERPVSEGHLAVGFDDDATYHLPAGEYFCLCDCDLFTRIRFDGEATVRNRSHGRFSITFPHPTPLTIAGKSPVEIPQARLTVEPSVSAVARGISHLSASLRTTGTSRVHRNYRGYPPRIELGSETTIPDSIRASRPETGIELVVPKALGAVYTAAPVAYFLGARLVPTNGRTPRLVTHDPDATYEIRTDRSFADGILSILRRTFFLELLVDWIEPDAPTVEAHTSLRSAGIDLDGCRDRPLAERVGTYLEFPSDPVDDVLPDWPYRMTIESTPSSVSAIPHLLEDLAAIDSPETASGPGAASHARAGTERSATERLRGAMELHGSLGSVDRSADFEARLESYENRLQSIERDCETTSVVVATGPAIDPALAEELAAAYTDRDETVSTIVETLVEPTCESVRRTLSTGVDYLHYVGSCSDGLACRDGRVHPGTVDELDASIVQLDGTDARTLVDAFVSAGAVAVVSRDGPGDPDPIVGTLVLYGQSVATAVRCRRLVTSDPSVTVTGDGSHRFVATWKPTPIQTVTPRDDGSLSITTVPFSVDPVGAHWRPDYDTGIHLMPSSYAYSIDPPQFDEHFLHNTQVLLTDDGVYLPDEQHRLLYPIA
ncbi:hypothetical protein [Halovivax cerinus]|uniref:Uncharacterized protein n=1 Tax=Halovivax cerinus TaxID=1487865 RepID=A0ABD5NID0_9EURY|nr:hypothetical protein [Halovivax cerinus]